MAIGRNEPCFCGSGQKYKNCHAGKSTRGVSKGLLLLLAVIGIVAAVGIGAAIMERNDAATTTPGAANPAGVGRPQPGPAPPGKVWSAEHGHWHDAAPAQTGQPAPAQPAAQQFKPGPQPPGPVPAGKVWSTEHGHWHDAPK